MAIAVLSGLSSRGRVDLAQENGHLACPSNTQSFSSPLSFPLLGQSLSHAEESILRDGWAQAVVFHFMNEETMRSWVLLV